MIVEDKESITSVVEELLKGAGYDVVAKAVSGGEAVEFYEAARPDLVLMDLVLPDFSGLDASRKILSKHPEARIIAITALSREGIVDESLKTGCRAFLLKPFRMKDLMKTVSEVLSKD
jgi:two-component system chemotaxis response regulator CheY